MLNLIKKGIDHDILSNNVEEILVIRNPTYNTWQQVVFEEFDEEVRESSLYGIMDDKNIYLFYFNDMDLKDEYRKQIANNIKQYYNIKNPIEFYDNTLYDVSITFENENNNILSTIKNNNNFKNAYKDLVEEYDNESIIEINNNKYTLKEFLGL